MYSIIIKVYYLIYKKKLAINFLFIITYYFSYYYISKIVKKERKKFIHHINPLMLIMEVCLISILSFNHIFCPQLFFLLQENKILMIVLIATIIYIYIFLIIVYIYNGKNNWLYKVMCTCNNKRCSCQTFLLKQLSGNQNTNIVAKFIMTMAEGTFFFAINISR